MGIDSERIEQEIKEAGEHEQLVADVHGQLWRPDELLAAEERARSLLVAEEQCRAAMAKAGKEKTPVAEVGDCSLPTSHLAHESRHYRLRR